MTDRSQYDPPLTADQHYEMSLKYFHQAKTIFENILKPNEEVSLMVTPLSLSTSTRPVQVIVIMCCVILV